MKILKWLVPTLLCSVMIGCSGNGTIVDQIQKSAETVLGSGGLTTSEITAGLKEALNQGTGTVVSQLGKKGGFSSDQLIRIPLPDSLLKAKTYADKVGLGSHFVDLENKLNQAAELATPRAKSLFVSAIKDMSVTDAKGILTGPDDAATRYFEANMSERLGEEMRPIVAESLNQVGAVRGFNNLLDKYKKIPLAPKIDVDLTQYVVDGGVNGIFHYVAEEEKAIRQDPLKRTTELLQRVFAAQ